MSVLRPPLRYHGGKWKLAPWIIEHMPRHRAYVEPFGGGASVLLRKDRSHGEVYNDLNGEIVNFFRVLRDQGEELMQAVALTPFAREEYVESYEPSDDAVEQARRTLVRSRMGFGSNSLNESIKSGFRANSDRAGKVPAMDWRSLPLCMAAMVDRLRGVVIENRDGLRVMESHDGPETLHYVDPPYVMETRCFRNGYRHDFDEEDHGRLLEFLGGLRGMVVLSGYRHAIYEELGWWSTERDTFADGARARREVLWLNAAAQERLERERCDMFGIGGVA